MTGEPLSLQEIIRQRQQAEFVGREERLAEFGANLLLRPADHRRRFVFNIHGVAGVGKTFLTQHFRRVAEGKSAACAYADENCFDVLETLSALSADLKAQGHELEAFEKQLETYRQRRHEVDADPKAPASTFLTKSAVKIGLHAARGVPGLGAVAEAVDADATAEQIDRLRAYLSKKFHHSDDVQLLMSPTEVLSKLFVSDLAGLATTGPVTLYFDTFERTGPFLERWLLDLLGNRYGSLPADLVITIAGQRPLDSNRWSPYRGIVADVPLTPFTEAEARKLLTARGVHDEQVTQVIMTLSGRLPVWLATLADRQPTETTSVAYPSDSAVERFLKWEPEEERRTVVLSAALPRKLNEDILKCLCEDSGDPAELFSWLRQLPFVTETAGSWQYHDVARAPMLRMTRSRSPQRWRAQHRRLASYHCGERDALAVTGDDRWSHASWQDHHCEATYHHLCADPATALPGALADAVYSLWDGKAFALRWATMLTTAGRDSGAEAVERWGRRLEESLRTETYTPTLLLTALIDDGKLPAEVQSEALRQRGRWHRLDGQNETALADFTRALSLQPESDSALVGRGRTYYQMERYAEALTDFTRAIVLSPDDDDAFEGRGQTYLTLARFDDASADFDRAIELAPTGSWNFVRRGHVRQYLQRYDEALADFTHVLEREPGNAWALASRGDTYRVMDQHENALADLNHAIEIVPDYGVPYMTRGLVHLAAERIDDALADLDRAIELRPDSDYYLANRGDLHRLLKNREKALADFTRAIEIDPEYTEVIVNRGRTYQELDRHDDAIADFTRAIEIDAYYDWAIAMRGWTYLKMNRLEAALIDLDQCLLVAPENTFYLTIRGDIQLRAGRYDASDADFTRAIEIDPDYDWAIAKRGMSYLKRARYREAQIDFDRSFALDPSSWSKYLCGVGRLMIGASESGAGELRSAIQLARQEIEAEPEDLQNEFNLAVYQAALGDSAEAERGLLDCLARNPMLDLITDFLADLAGLPPLPGLDRQAIDALAGLASAELDRRTSSSHE